MDAAEAALDQIEALAAEYGEPEEIDLSPGPHDQTWPSQRASYAVKALAALMSGIPIADQAQSSNSGGQSAAQR